MTEKLSPIVLRQLLSFSDADAITKNTTLIESISLDDNPNKLILSITCKNSAIITQLRHSQVSLLANLNQAILADAEVSALLSTHSAYNMVNVSALKLKVSARSKPSTEPNNGSLPYPNVSGGSHTASKPTFIQKTQSRESADLIYNFSNQLKDTDLSDSLKSLAATINKRRSDPPPD